MIRIDVAADLADLFGGQTDFEVAVYWTDADGGFDIIGAGHTVAEAVAEARRTFRDWEFSAIPAFMLPANETTKETR